MRSICMRWRGARAAGGCLALAVIVACPASTLPADQLAFACRGDADCAPGQRCLAGTCAGARADAGAVATDRGGGADAASRDRAVTDLRAADRPAVDAARSDASLPDATSTDLVSPDVAVPDVVLPDVLPPDVALPDVLVPDVLVPDVAQPDVALPDTALPDTALPDTALPDTALPDAALPDTALPDVTLPDAWSPVVVAEDFADGSLDGWTTGSGTWSATGGVLQQTTLCEDNTDLMLDGGDWADLRASVRVRFDAVCSSGLRQAALLVRVAGVAGCTGNRYYGCLLDVDNDDIVAAEWDGACVTGLGSWGDTVPLVEDTWYTLEARVVGSRLDCQVSGPGLATPGTATRTDGARLITSGSVGLDSWTAQVSFDDLLVELL